MVQCMDLFLYAYKPLQRCSGSGSVGFLAEDTGMEGNTFLELL